MDYYNIVINNIRNEIRRLKSLGLNTNTKNDNVSKQDYVYRTSLECRLPSYELEETEVRNNLHDRTTVISLRLTDLEKMPESASYISSTIVSQNFEFTGVEKVNFTHDYTIKPILTRTDVPLSEWKRLGNVEDHLTPDGLLLIEGSTVFFEITTNKSNSEQSFQRDIQKKREKYNKAINDRLEAINRDDPDSQNSAYLFVMSIGYNMICTNFPLTEEITEFVHEPCIRFALAVDIEYQLVLSGRIKTARDEELSADMVAVRRMFEAMEYNTQGDDLPLTKPLSQKELRKFVYPSEIEKRRREESIQKKLTEITNEAFKEQLRKSSVLRRKVEKSLDEDSVKWFERLKVDKRAIDESLSDSQQRISDYSTSVQDILYRSDLKAVCPFPCVILKSSNEQFNSCQPSMSRSVNSLRGDFKGAGNPTGTVWEQVLDKISFTNVIPDDETEEEQYIRAMNPKPSNSSKRKFDYHRVPAELDKIHMIELAKVGIRKKEFGHNPIVQDYVRSKKVPFNLDVDTEDIEDFINREGPSLITTYNSTNKTTEKTKDLMLSSLKLHLKNEEVQIMDNIVEQLLSTQFMSWCKLVADISTEISISLKQHVSKSNFIVKKLKDYNMFLLLRPTTQDGMINYSLMWHQSDVIAMILSSAFPKINQSDEYYYTDFRSTNKDKLCNQTQMEMIGFNMLCFWLNEMKINIFEENFLRQENQSEDLKEALKLASFSVLVSMEDKKQTEEVLTMVRYIYMEGFVSYPKVPNPQKMIDKFPTFIKGRLTAFCLNKLISLITYITAGNYFYPTLRRDDVENTVSYRQNMINFITGRKMEDVNVMINLMYVGYLNNKNELMQGNKVNSLYKKIIEMELIFTKEIQETIGLIEHENRRQIKELKKHEYSVDVLHKSLQLSMAKLESIRGSNVKSQIEDAILRKLSLTNVLSTFGTLKSSSTFDSETDFKYPIGEIYEFMSEFRKKELNKENDRPTRTKVILASLEYLKEYPALWNLVPVCMNELHEKDRIDVDLFDKAQHGGIREIFILNFATRVCQFVFESISRTLCEFFPMEMMTHPKNKDILMTNHANLSKELFKGQPNITMSASDDAEKWNQTHYVGKFGQMLCFFTPEYMWPFISNLMKLWFKRRIKIDPRLVKIMEMHETLEVEDQTFQQLYRMYKGIDPPVDWYKGGKKRYIEIKSGFMQGILHYTSSLFHVMSLELTSWLAQEMISRFLFSLNLSRSRQVITMMVSSDDSSMMITLPAYTSRTAQIMCICSDLCFEIKTQVGKSLGIYLSKKSTQNTLFCMEFNSIFNFSESRYHAYIKQIIAAGTVSEKESLASRQEEMSTNLTAVLENGGSFLLTSLCQFGQGLLHYRLLGATVLPIVCNRIYPALEILKDPSVGYFIMDNPVIAGIAGFKYNLWNLIQTEPKMSCLYKYMLDNAVSKEVIEGVTKKQTTLNTTGTGVFTNSIIIPYGENRKLMKAQEILDADESVFETVNSEPEILYRKPRTSDELLIHAKLKMLSPGVSESFSRGIGLAKLMAQSVYLVVNSILAESSNYYSASTQLIGSRTSLTKRLMENLEITMNSDFPLSGEELEVLFPTILEFKSLKLNTQLVNMTESLPKLKKSRNVKSVVVIQESEVCLIPTNQLVAWKWFNKQVGLSRNTCRDLWDRLKIGIKWLRDDPDETLKLSPFGNHYQILNFFSRLDVTSRRVQLLGAPLGHGSSHANILTVACRNPWKGFEFVMTFDEKVLDETLEFRSIRHSIYMLINSPLTKRKKTEMIETMLNNSRDVGFKHKQLNSSRVSLHFMQKFVKISKSSMSQTDKKKELEVLLTEIHASKFGISGGFTLRQKLERVGPQKKLNYVGRGIWVGKIGEFNCKLEINSRKIESGQGDTFVSYLEEVHVNKPKLTNEFVLQLHELCRELHVSNDFTDNMHHPTAIAKLNKFFISGTGTPVFYSPSLKSVYEREGDISLEMILRDNICNLRIKVSEGTGWRQRETSYNMLSYVSRPEDFDITVSETFTSRFGFKRFISTWIMDKPMETRELYTFIKTVKEAPEQLHQFDLMDLRSWIRDGFNSALIKQGMLTTKPVFRPQEMPVNEPEFHSDLDLMDQINELIAWDVNETLDLDDCWGTTAAVTDWAEESGSSDNDLNVDTAMIVEAMGDLNEYLKQKDVNLEEELEVNTHIRMNNNIFVKFVNQLMGVHGRKALHDCINRKLINRSFSQEDMQLIAFMLMEDESNYRYVYNQLEETQDDGLSDDFI